MRIWVAASLAVFFGSTAFAQTIVQGKADFSKHNFSDHRPIDLEGPWEFYWNQLLEPKDFGTDLKPEWVYVPLSWHRAKYPRLGVATYRLKILLPENQSGLAIHFPIINCASKVWFNGELTGETGVVSPDQKVYKAKLASMTLPVPEQIRELEIVIQAANFTYYSSGIGSLPQLGENNDLFLALNKMNGVENFFSGSLIAMCIYQLILYFLYHRGKPHLWLALICVGVAVRSLVVHGGSFLLPNLFPSVAFEIWKKMEFGSVYAIAAFFPLYIYHLFTEAAPKKPLYVFIGISGILCTAVLVTPQYVYGSLLEVCHITLLFGFIYAFYSIISAWRSGNKDAKVILFGVLTSFPFILMEILKNSVLFPVNIGFMYLVEVGVLAFLLFQVYLLANHHAQSYRSLQEMNLNLEKAVEERTRQMVQANAVKDKLLSVMSHDLKSPLNALQGILHVYNSGSIEKNELDQFTRQIESDLGNTNLLVDNVLHWTISQQKGLNLKMEKFNLGTLIEENLHLFKSMAGRKKISMRHNLSGPYEINWDQNILNLVLRNLLANAIKFSYEGGEIKVLVDSTNRNHTIQVVDYGVGMTSEQLQTLLSAQRVSSLNGTINEKGTGLGLSLCRDYLVKAGATLNVESTEGKGSTFTVSIPIQ